MAKWPFHAKPTENPPSNSSSISAITQSLPTRRNAAEPQITHLGHRKQAVVEVSPSREHHLVAVLSLDVYAEECLREGDSTHE
jgi:hypothetical protein